MFGEIPSTLQGPDELAVARLRIWAKSQRHTAFRSGGTRWPGANTTPYPPIWAPQKSKTNQKPHPCGVRGAGLPGIPPFFRVLWHIDTKQDKNINNKLFRIQLAVWSTIPSSERRCASNQADQETLPTRHDLQYIGKALLYGGMVWGKNWRTV